MITVQKNAIARGADRFTMFIERLLSGPRGQIVACNIVDGLDLDLIDETDIRKLFDAERTLYGSRPPANDRSAIGRLINLANARRLFQKCKIKPTSLDYAGTRTFANIILRCHFVGLFDEAILCRSLIYKYRTTSVPDADFAEIDRFNGNFDALKEDAQLGYGSGIVFLTDYLDLSTALAGAAPATDARNRLGLVHHKADVPLMAVWFSADPAVKDALLMNRPIAFDAGWHSRFRCLPDRIPSAGGAAAIAGDEGYTLDLANFSRRDPKVNGAREYVSTVVPDLRGRQPVWKGLGYTADDGEPLPEDVMDEQMVRILLRGRTRDDIDQRLREYL